MQRDSLAEVLSQCWNRRTGAVEWAAATEALLTTLSTSDREAAISRLCALLVEQLSVGPSPSPLLLSYLSHAFATRLFSIRAFFGAFSFEDAPIKPQRVWITVSLAREFLPVLLIDSWAHGRTSPTETQASQPTTTLLRVGFFVAKHLAFALEEERSHEDNANDVGVDVLEARRQRATEELIEWSTDILSTLFEERRAVALILVERQREPSAWESLIRALANVKHIVTTSSLASKYPRLVAVWGAMALMMATKGNCIPFTPDPQADEWCGFLRGGLAWLAMALEIEEHTPNFHPLSSCVCRDRLDSLRRIHRLPPDCFYSEIIVACVALHTQSDVGSREWICWRVFLLGVLPRVLAQLEDLRHQTEKESSQADGVFSPSKEIFPVEEAVSALLTFRNHNDLMSKFVQALVLCGVVREENIQTLIPLSTPPTQREPLSIETLLQDGYTPRSIQEVEGLVDLLMSMGDRTPGDIATAFRLFTPDMLQETVFHEPLLHVLLKLVSPSTHTPYHVLCEALTRLSDFAVACVARVFGESFTVLSLAMQTCCEWGGRIASETTDDPHPIFGSAFMLMVQLLEDLEVQQNPTTRERVSNIFNLDLPEPGRSTLKMWYTHYLYRQHVPLSEGVEHAVDELIFRQNIRAFTPWQITLFAVPIWQQGIMSMPAESATSATEYAASVRVALQGMFEIAHVSPQAAVELIRYMESQLAFPHDSMSQDLDFFMIVFGGFTPPMMLRFAATVGRQLAVLLRHTPSDASVHPAVTSALIQCGRLHGHLETMGATTLSQNPKKFVADSIAHISCKPSGTIPVSMISSIRRFAHTVGPRRLTTLLVEELLEKSTVLGLGCDFSEALRRAEHVAALLILCGGLSALTSLSTHILPMLFSSVQQQIQGILLAHCVSHAFLFAGVACPSLPSEERSIILGALSLVLEGLTELVESFVCSPSACRSFPHYFLVHTLPIAPTLLRSTNTARLARGLWKLGLTDLALAILDLTSEEDRVVCEELVCHQHEKATRSLSL